MPNHPPPPYTPNIQAPTGMPMALEERYRILDEEYRTKEQNIARHRQALKDSLERQAKLERGINLQPGTNEVFWHSEEEWAPMSRREIERGLQHIRQLEQGLNKAMAQLDVHEKNTLVLIDRAELAETNIGRAQLDLQIASTNHESVRLSLQSQINDLIKARDDALSDATVRKLSANDRCTTLSKELSQVKKERDEAKAALLKKPGQAGLNKQIQDLKKDRDAANAQAAKYKKKYDNGFASSSIEFDTMRRERDDAVRCHQTGRANFNKQYNAAKGEIGRLNLIITEGRQAYAKKQKELAAAQQECEKLRRQLHIQNSASATTKVGEEQAGAMWWRDSQLCEPESLEANW
ncbi:hypothetical protein QBC40DRAFT_322051 [Triangularia verruculosa]|uniref:Uncharacterized protein n=1 Tax=Triangularia verruculosa TaxID=2587418 RepID=A0AAN7AMC8_9PEZI|nr:hypothetical protein QBC40DRAFT_322051 [Triangularia verruculosa]